MEGCLAACWFLRVPGECGVHSMSWGCLNYSPADGAPKERYRRVEDGAAQAGNLYDFAPDGAVAEDFGGDNSLNR